MISWENRFLSMWYECIFYVLILYYLTYKILRMHVLVENYLFSRRHLLRKMFKYICVGSLKNILESVLCMVVFLGCFKLFWEARSNGFNSCPQTEVNFDLDTWLQHWFCLNFLNYNLFFQMFVFEINRNMEIYNLNFW